MTYALKFTIASRIIRISDDMMLPIFIATVLEGIAIMSLSSLIQTIGNGVTRELLSDNKIIAYTLTSTSRSAVDAWIEALLQEVTNWSYDRPLRLLIDQSPLAEVPITPYMKFRLAELAKLTKGKPSHTAVVFHDGFFWQIAMTLLHSGIIRTDAQVNYFTYRENAIAWLCNSPSAS